MAHETSAPNIKMIAAIAVTCVVSLAAIDLVLKSYYVMMFEEEEAVKVLRVPTTQLNALREAETVRLTSGKMPIDKAMRDLAARGLDNGTPRKIGTVDLTPDLSNDPAPMIGWAQLAKDAGPGAATPAPTPVTSAPGDGGTGSETGVTGDSGATDAGAAVPTTTTTSTSDAGAKPHVALEAGTHG